MTPLPNAPPNLPLKVHRPDGSLAYSGGIIDWNSDQRGSFGDILLTTSGTYRFEITDSGNTDLIVFFAPNVVWQIYEKTYFYYGIVALFISAIYPCTVGTGLAVKHKQMTKRSRSPQQNKTQVVDANDLRANFRII